MSGLIGVLLALLALAAYYLVYKPWRFLRFFASQGVPHKPFVPLAGQLKDFERLKDEEFIGYWLKGAQEIGPNFGLCMGPYPVLMLSDPQTCHDIFTTKARHYNKHSETAKELVRPLLKNGLLVSEGEHWKKQRELLEPAFHHLRLQAMVKDMVRGADAMVARWRGRGRVDAHKETAKVGLDIVATAAFGESFGEDEAAMERVTEAHAQCLKSMKERILVSLMPVVNKWPVAGLPEYQAAAGVIHQAADDVLQARLAEGREGEPRDMLDMLVALHRAGRMSAGQLREEAINVLAAGAETTSNLMSWLLYALASRPELWRRCVDEVDRVLPRGEKPTAEKLRELHLVEACAYEALRVYAPAPMLHKIANEEHTLRSAASGEFVVPAGTHVIVNAQMVHRDPEVWPRPLEFDPSRFLASTPGEMERLRKRPPFSFVAFSAGPRKCLGKNFAMLEIKTVMARVLQHYRCEVEPGQTIAPDPGSQSPSNGIWMRVEERTEAEREEGAARNAGRKAGASVVKPVGMI